MNVNLPARGAGLSWQDTGKLKIKENNPAKLRGVIFMCNLFSETAAYKP